MARLLFLIDDDSYFCWHRLDLARTARDEGYEVVVATHVNQHGAQIEKEGFKLLPIRFRRGIRNPLHECVTLAEVMRLYRRECPDIIHHISLKHVLYGSVAARLTGMPAIVNAFTGLGTTFASQTTKAKLLRSGIKAVLRWSLAHPCSKVTFENNDDREDLIAAGIVSQSQTVVIRGVGINVSDFTPQIESHEPAIVLLASRMLWDKGVGEFVEAARLIKHRFPSVRCVLVGAVDPESDLGIDQAQLQSWESEGLVEWWGHQEDMKDVYRQAHVVVLPTYYGEGLPRVLLEAAASGKPLVATDWRGCREIVRDGDNGLLVPIRDSKALAHAVLNLLADKGMRTRMGVRGREIAVGEFSSEQVAKETIAVYRRLLEDTVFARSGLRQ
jgi:glycosyltransferase involved in cell wall biosynthesis